MPKTKEELRELKKEYESLKTKLKELSKDELKQVTGGFDFNIPGNDNIYEHNIYNDDPDNKFKNKL